MTDLDEQRIQKTINALYELTPREQEVLELVIRGMDNKMIAEQMFISVNTSKRHVKHILHKFDSRKRCELLCRLLELGEYNVP